MSGAACRGCGASLRHTFVDLGMSPLCESFLEAGQLNQMEPFYPLHVWVCDACFLVQLEEYVDPREIFGEYAYFSSYSDSWLQHARTYTERMQSRFGLGPSSFVVELASNDGYLLRWFVEKGIRCLGIEPAANVAKAAEAHGVPTMVRFFGRELAQELAAAGHRADLVVGNNVLAQVTDLNGFVAGIKILLAEQGVATLEFPHLLRLMEENQFDTIYHEHFSYFSLATTRRLFAAHGLTVFDVEELKTHGGSLRLYARHDSDQGKPVGESVPRLIEAEAAAGLTRLDGYFSFTSRVLETKRRLLELLIGIKRRGQRIAGYGAPGKGNTLLNYCGIRGDFLDFTVDRSPYKHGRYLPGTHVPILPTEAIAERKPDYVLILPWNLKDEIIEQMAGIREWGGQFIVPIPEARIVP